MRNRFPSFGSVLAGTTAFLCISGGQAGAQNKNPAIAGTWGYDAQRTKTEEGRKMSDAPAFSADDRSRSRSSAAGATSGVPGAGRELGALALYSKPIPQLVIVQTDSTVTVTDANGMPRTYRTDGKKSLEPLLGSDSLEVTARWRGGKLTTERKIGRHGVVRQEFSLDAATSALIVEVRLSGPQLVPPMEMRWFYKTSSGSN